MKKQQTDQKNNVALTNWTINNFPKILRLRFAGIAKLQGVSVTEQMEQVIRQFLSEFTLTRSSK